MKRHRWFWGLFFILGAALLVATKMHWINYEASTFTIVASVILLAVFIESVLAITIPGIVFSLAFAGILYAQPLGITALVPWTILGAALLLSIGLSVIFNTHGRHHLWSAHHAAYQRHHRQYQQWQTDNDTQADDSANVSVNVRMGNSIRYVQSDNLQVLNADVYMGTAKIYLDQARPLPQATVNLNVELGGLELYIPQDWNVALKEDVFLSGVEEKGLANTKTGPTIILQGRLKMAGLTIIYV